MSETEKEGQKERATPKRILREVGKPSPRRLAAALIARAEGRLVLDTRRDDAA